MEQLLESLRGQGIEIYWRDNMRCPTEEEYKQMALKKTGGAFMLIVELMQLFSKNKFDFRKFINLLALIFQIKDDYDNLVSKECMQRKSFCDDFTEGKFSFPIIHAIKTHPDDQQIMNILRQRTDDVELKKLGVSLLSQYGSFKYTRQILDKLTKDIREEMRKFPDNPYMMEFLNTLSDYNSVKVLYKA